MPKFSAATAGLALALAAPAYSAPYTIDPTHTFVHFEVMHFGTSTSRGRFERSSGTLSLDRAAKTGAVDITIDTGSVSTGVPTLDKQLRGDKFFHVEAFPTARFVADNFQFNADQLSEVSGQFTMLGKTLPVTLKATRFNCYPHPFLKREVCGGDFEARIQRSQWGLSIYTPDMIGEQVRLLIQIEAIKQ